MTEYNANLLTVKTYLELAISDGLEKGVSVWDILRAMEDMYEELREVVWGILMTQQRGHSPLLTNAVAQAWLERE